jgi:hypothetical protein
MLVGAGGSLILAGCGSGAARYGDAVDGIGCDQGANVTFEAAVRLSLVRGGQREAPTGGVGSTGSACIYWVRTEDDEGIIHVRAPHPVTPTLATFFAIWDLAIPQGSANSAPFRDAAEKGEITVNGMAVPGGASAVVLTDGVTIELHAPQALERPPGPSSSIVLE